LLLTPRAFRRTLSPVTQTTLAASVISTRSRRIVVGDLLPGTIYSLQARAIGGREGCSEWSNPVSRMAT